MAHWDPDDLTDPVDRSLSGLGWELDDIDLAFAQIAQGARVDGATLPSGFKVPVTPGKRWIIEHKYLRCIECPNYDPNVQAQLPE